MLNANLTITQIGGQPDSLSPHSVEIVMYELAEGNADSVIITNAPQLSDDSIYKYEFREQTKDKKPFCRSLNHAKETFMHLQALTGSCLVANRYFVNCFATNGTS